MSVISERAAKLTYVAKISLIIANWIIESLKFKYI